MNGPTLTISAISPSGAVTVRIGNESKGPIRIWQDSNSWGAARWRVSRLVRGHLEAFYQNPDQMFTRNIPTSIEIGAGKRIEQTLDLNGGNWCGYGRCSSYGEHGFGGREARFEPGDVVVVAYDVPRTNEASKLSVWYGMTAAATTVP